MRRSIIRSVSRSSVNVFHHFFTRPSNVALTRSFANAAHIANFDLTAKFVNIYRLPLIVVVVVHRGRACFRWRRWVFAEFPVRTFHMIRLFKSTRRARPVTEKTFLLVIASKAGTARSNDRFVSIVFVRVLLSRPMTRYSSFRVTAFQGDVAECWIIVALHAEILSI